MVEIGTHLGGRYRLIELLGQGGMATIYRGRDTQLGRDVAVKVLRPQYGRDADFLARFRQEAQAVARLNDPNVVAVYDIGEDAAGPFIVMEYVPGEDLASLLRRNGPLPPRQAARVAAEVARALEAAHAVGIVHRDVKPPNVLIATDGRVKVTDFGIARALSDAQLTLPGTTMGSVHYLAPEQVRGLAATPASDVYALGIVLYEMLTGRRPWEGDTAATVAMGRLSGAVPGPSDHVAVPAALDGIVRHALALDPADRFPSAASMAEELDGFLASTSAAAAGAGPAPGTPAPRPARPRRATPLEPAGVAIEERVDEVVAERPPARGTSPWTWVAGLAGLLVLAAVAFVVFRVVTGLSGTPAGAVPVPKVVGMSLEDARSALDAVGLSISIAPKVSPDQPVGTVLDQDPPADTLADRGSTVTVTVATGTTTVAVPDLRGRTEADAIAALFAAGLANGARQEAYDPVVPAGSVVSQAVAAGTQSAKGTPVDYSVSKGPEPIATPTSEPSPSASASASPSASVPPSPTPLAVGEYRCLMLDDATAQIVAEGFTVGTVTSNPVGESYDGTWLVQAQVPMPGETRPAGTPIRLTVISPTSACP